MDHLRTAKVSGSSTGSAPAEMKAAELDTLDFFLRRLTRESAREVMAAPSNIVAGAQIFAGSGCSTCHTVNGVGGSIGPVLNGVAKRHTREWIAQHLSDPSSQSPDTVMPAFHFSAPDRDLLITYLLSLPGK